MKISFHGAARTVTGSKHLLQLDNGKNILLDCGLFQGMGKETIALNNDWGFDPKSVDVVVLSHAHIDHSGLLPKLVKDGFEGKIWCTTATAELTKVLLIDSARIQESDVRFVNTKRDKENKEPVKPLYTEEDATSVFPNLYIVDYDEPIEILDDVMLTFTDCGHILGSAAVNLSIQENGKTIKLTFSGDVGRYRDVILRSPEKFPQADCIIMESTYGNSLHDLNAIAADQLLEFIENTCIKQRGKLVIPSFSLGRTQELLYLLNRLDLEKRLPKISYFVDSPLSIQITEIIKKHPECFDKQVQKLLKQDEDVFSFKGLYYIDSVEESIKLNASKEPCVIISASGMADAGRVKHHIKHVISEARNTILIVGYCEPMSLGGRLRNGATHVSIHGTHFDVKAQVGVMKSLSAHGDYEDLCQWLACQDPNIVNQVFLVHGEYDEQQPFGERLRRKGFKDVIIPNLHETYNID